MPALRRRRSFGRSGSRRRKLVWATLPPTQTFVSNVVPAPDVFGGLRNFDLLNDLRQRPGAGLLGITIMRTILDVQVNWVAASVLDLSQQGVMFGLVAEDVDEVQADSISPMEFYRDWAWWASYYPGNGVNTVGSQPGCEGYRFDIRAKRKVQELNQTWCWAMFGTPTLTQNVPIQLSARCLIALP